MTQTAGMPASKAKKILRRTMSGGALVAAVAALLLWISHSSEGRPLYWGAAIVLCAALVETIRMGSFAKRELAPALFLSAIAAFVIVNASIETWQARHAFVPDQPRAFAISRLLTVLPFVLAPLTAVAAFHLSTLLPSWERFKSRVLAYVVIGALLLLLSHEFRDGPPSMTLALPLILFIAALGTVRGVWRKQAQSDALLAAALALWLVPPLALVWVVWAAWGTSGLVAFLVLSKIGDTFGYYVGNALGKTHPFPKLSPGKTTAGCVGSFLGVTAVGGLLYQFGVLPQSHLGISGALLAAAILNIAAQAGDLLESFVKRRAGVKDSSTVFGPSGGMLDQIDSLLLAVPAALATWPWIFGTTSF